MTLTEEIKDVNCKRNLELIGTSLMKWQPNQLEGGSCELPPSINRLN